MSESTKNAPGTRPFAAYEWMIAFRYLRAKRKESFVSVISGFSLAGIALGVATLIIVMSVMGGFRIEFLKSILGFGGHVTVQASRVEMMDYDARLARLKTVPGVIGATAVVDGQALATQNGVNSLALVRGIRSADLAGLTIVSKTLTEGALDRFKDGEVIIGAGLANRMGLAPGDSITLYQPRGNSTPFGTTPYNVTYVVGGIFKVGNTVDDNTVVFMPLDKAQALFNTGEGVNSIELTVSKPDRDAELLPAIARVAGPDVRLITWQELNGAFMDAVQVEGDVMFLILSLIIVVAVLNIVSGLTMLVKDKSRDIAILRTMGASRGAVMRVFMITGMSIGISGTLLGLVLGLVFCLNIEEIRQGLQHLTGTTLFDPTIYFLSRIPADVDPVEVVKVVAIALVPTFLATLYPSWRAARLDPVEALRYE